MRVVQGDVEVSWERRGGGESLGNQKDKNCKNDKNDTKSYKQKIHSKLKFYIRHMGGHP
jgi:hypothetical protein